MSEHRGREPLLAISGLHKSFGGLVAVNELAFAVDEGEILGLIGPNGSGKTTVLNLITGDIRPDAGHVRLSAATSSGLGLIGFAAVASAGPFNWFASFLA